MIWVKPKMLIKEVNAAVDLAPRGCYKCVWFCSTWREGSNKKNALG